MHLRATTHQGHRRRREHRHRPAFLRDRRGAITDLVRRYLGPQPRAGQTVLPATSGGDEEVVNTAAGFTGPQRLNVPGAILTRTAEQVLAATHFLSSAAPHVFGDRLDALDADLRHLLAATSDDGRFSEWMRAIDLDLWR